MDSHDNRATTSSSVADCHAPDITIPELVGKIYDVAPTNERCRMLEHLIKPLGALALVGVCNGIFTKIWFRSGWNNLHIQPEDAQVVQAIDVISLARYVQQANAEVIDGLASMLTTSPMIACSAAAAMLVTVLVRRIKPRRTGYNNVGEPHNFQ